MPDKLKSLLEVEFVELLVVLLTFAVLFVEFAALSDACESEVELEVSEELEEELPELPEELPEEELPELEPLEPLEEGAL